MNNNKSMGISSYLKEIGRSKDGARALSRPQAHDLMAQLLDGQVSDLEVGAFCIAMRVKGETPEEMAGFLDAIQARLPPLPASRCPTVVLPSYNGARKLPVLTPLLALLLAQRGVRVVIHGPTREPGRLTTHEVLRAIADLDGSFRHPIHFASEANGVAIEPSVMFIATETLLPGLQRLLDARRVIGLRNSAHSLVKMMQVVPGALLVSSYTHPEYLHTMGMLFELTGQPAMLLRGTEGEPVADPRRTPQMDLYVAGQRTTLQIAQSGTLHHLPTLPAGADVAATAALIVAICRGHEAAPASIQAQVNHICAALNRIPVTPVSQAHTE